MILELHFLLIFILKSNAGLLKQMQWCLRNNSFFLFGLTIIYEDTLIIGSICKTILTLFPPFRTIVVCFIICLTLYLIEVPCDAYAIRADPDQAALVR